MIRRSRHRYLILPAALAVLSLRALAPDGYMPATPGSGLLFELCPDGMPAEVMQALSGGGHHHHHGAHGTDDASGAASECPIGHMLSPAASQDADGIDNLEPNTPSWMVAGVRPSQGRRHAAYRSRAPPA